MIIVMNRYLRMALFLGTMVVATSVSEEIQAKPYACGKETCEAHKTKANCQVCKQAVCDKDGKGKEYLVPGTATTTKCEEKPKAHAPPTQGQPPVKGGFPSRVTPGQLAPLQTVPTPDKGGVRPTVPAQPPAKQ